MDKELFINDDDLFLIEASTSFTISKAKDDSQQVFGWASVSMTEKGTPAFDWQGDIIPIQVLEKAAYDFVLNFGETGEMHYGEAKGDLIESVVFTKEKMEAMGIPVGILPEAWWVGFYIPDMEVFAKIKNGTYRMFSIHGKIKKLKV